jgi:hypothetical protein
MKKSKFKNYTQIRLIFKLYDKFLFMITVCFIKLSSLFFLNLNFFISTKKGNMYEII